MLRHLPEHGAEIAEGVPPDNCPIPVGPHRRGDVHDPAALELLEDLGREAVRALEVADLRGRQQAAASLHADVTQRMSPKMD